MSSTTRDRYPEGIYRWQNNFEWIVTAQDLTYLTFYGILVKEQEFHSNPNRIIWLNMNAEDAISGITV